MMSSEHQTRVSVLLHPLSVLAILAATIWLAHFYNFSGFGFYEDDHAVVAPYLDKNFSDVGNLVVTCFKRFPWGRPLAYIFPSFAACLAGKLGGVKVLYLFGFSVITLNAFLLYLVLNKYYQKSQLFALSGAFAFCLFPADAARILLTHSLILQPSLSFFLFATLCYLHGWRKFSYFCIIGSLLTYESPFLIFIGVPFLSQLCGRQLVREFLRHIFVLGVMIVVIVVIRKLTGESRVTEVLSNPLIVFLKIIAGVCIGPLTTFFLFFRAPLVAIARWQEIPWLIPFSWGVCLLGLLGFLVNREIPMSLPQLNYLTKLRLRNIQLTEYCRMIFEKAAVGRQLLVGLVFLGLGYLGSFVYFPPIYLYGRITSVHLAAAFGASLLFASVFMLFWEGTRYHAQRVLVLGVISTYLTLLVGYHCLIQNDFVASWRYQKAYWANVVELCPDFADGLVIFLEREGLPETSYIDTHSWTDPIILKQMFQFPKEWKNPPRLFPIYRNWEDKVMIEGDKLTWEVPAALWDVHRETLQDGNVIILRQQKDKMIRLSGGIMIKGKSLKLKEPPTTLTVDFPKGAYFSYLVRKVATTRVEAPIQF